ncbi:choice-of-anchor D domain-containing protein [bacterium]|nr:choice-of-anchor D domain-containing protein [bacterium]
MRTAATLLAIFLTLGVAYAETTVEGVATGVWDVSHSPYYVTSDIVVPAGEELIIEPGTQIIFQGYYKMQIEPDAILKATGTLDNPIIFTAADTSTGFGGLVFYQSSDACTLDFVRIEYARKTGTYPFSFGGAVLTYQANPTIINSQFLHNSAPEGCGGAIAAYYSSPIIKHNIFKHNTCFYSGGAIFTLNSEPAIENNIIAHNYAQGSGGAIAFSENSSPYFVNNVIFDNTADSVGGAIDCSFSSSPFIINNTIVENYASIKGGAISTSYRSNPMIMNTIIRNNTSGDSSEVFLYGFSGYPCEVFISHCNIDLSRAVAMPISNIVIGSGNICENSEFADSLYHISALSPNIDAGVESDVYGLFVLTAPFYDLDGISRPIGASYDIGAYEYRPTAAMNVSPDTIEYGNVEIFADAGAEVTITSCGTGELIVYNIYTTNPAFVPEATHLTLPPDLSQDIQVVFTPTESEEYSDTLWICSNADTQFVVLHGEGMTPPNMVISDSIVDFGTVVEHTVEVEHIEITNTGEMNLEVFGIRATDDAFSTSVSAFELSSGETIDISLHFFPMEVGAYEDTLWIYSNADTQFVLLYANAGRKPTISLSDTFLDFGSILPDSIATLQVIITNTGDFDLDISGIVNTNPENFTMLCDHIPTIAPGSSHSIEIEAKVNSIGQFWGAVWFYSEYDTTRLHLTVKGSSTGIFGENEKLPQKPELLVYPNPFNSAINIEVTGELDGSENIDILTLDGREIAHLSQNEHIWKADETLPGGTYLIVVKTKAGTLNRKITYLK